MGLRDDERSATWGGTSCAVIETTGVLMSSICKFTLSFAACWRRCTLNMEGPSLPNRFPNIRRRLIGAGSSSVSESPGPCGGVCVVSGKEETESDMRCRVRDTFVTESKECGVEKQGAEGFGEYRPASSHCDPTTSSPIIRRLEEPNDLSY